MEPRQFLSNAHVLGPELSSLSYHVQKGKRGEKDFVMSRTELMLFARCPKSWLAGYKRPGSKAAEFGSLVDCIALTPGEFDKRYALAPTHYPATPARKSDAPSMKPWTRQANYCADWETEQEAAGKQVLKIKDYEEARDALRALYNYPDIRHVLTTSATQVHIRAEYRDGETKLVIPLKMLLDFVPPATDPDFGKMVGDLKTLTDASLRAWRRTVFYEDYDAQAALYFDAYRAARPDEERVEFCHILCESFHPYQPARRYLTSEFLDIGRTKYLRALRLYAKCLATNTWPDYDSEEGIRSYRGWLETAPEEWMLNAA